MKIDVIPKKMYTKLHSLYSMPMPHTIYGMKIGPEQIFLGRLMSTMQYRMNRSLNMFRDAAKSDHRGLIPKRMFKS